MADLSELRDKVILLKARRHVLVDDVLSLETQIYDLRKEIDDTEKAQILIKSAAQSTQETLQYHISELVSLALSSVFEDPYEFKLEFVQKRGKTEAELWFVKDEHKIKPIDASGGGAVDVASFALQLALWKIGQPQTRNTLILDEPLKWLKGDDMPVKGASIIKELSEKLGIQIIMVSHSSELIDAADTVFEVTKEDGVSEVKEI